MRIKIYLSFLFIICALASNVSFAATLPADDPCSVGAPGTLTVLNGAACTPAGTIWTTVGATPIGGTPPPGPCSGFDNNDVWFKFTVPVGCTQVIATVTGVVSAPNNQALNPQVYFYRDPANGCNPANFVPANGLGCAVGFPTATLNVGGLANPEVIYVRVKPSGGSPDGDFQICLTNPCPFNFASKKIYDSPCGYTGNEVYPVKAGPCLTTDYDTLSNICAATPNLLGLPLPGNGAFSCGAGLNYNGGDIWARVVVPAGGRLQINLATVAGSPIFDMAMAVYTANNAQPCNLKTFTEVACDDNSGPGNMPALNFPDPINFPGVANPGDTLYIRMWEEGNNAFGRFRLCITDPCPSGIVSPPAYDEPCGAIATKWSSTYTLPAGPCQNPADYITLSNYCATTTLSPDKTPLVAPNCSPFYPSTGFCGNDVWVAVTVPAGWQRIDFNTVFQAGSQVNNLDMAIYEYTGTCPGTPVFNFVTCNGNFGMPVISITDAAFPAFAPIAGKTFLVRMWARESCTIFGTWGLCINNPCPSNTVSTPLYDTPPCSPTVFLPFKTDTCAPSDFLTVSSECSNGWFETDPSGPTGINAIPRPGPSGAGVCGWTGYPDSAARAWDVWAAFVIPPGQPQVTVTTRFGTKFDVDMAIYKVQKPYALNCTDGTKFNFLGCDDVNSPDGFMPEMTLPIGAVTPGNDTLEAGDTVLIRFWHFFGGSRGNWRVCVSNPCPAGAIANDECSGATPLTVDSACSYPIFTTRCASTSAIPAAPTCGGFTGGFGVTSDDVWFTFIAPNSGQVEITTQAAQLTSMGMELYSGTCGALTRLTCHANGLTGGQMPGVQMSVTPGLQYYIRIWDKFGDQNGTFGICVRDLCPSLPSNNYPCNAQTLTLGTFVTGFNNCADNTNEGAITLPACMTTGDVNQNTVWYKILPPFAGSLIPTGTGTGIKIQIKAGTLAVPKMCVYRKAGTGAAVPCGQGYGTALTWASGLYTCAVEDPSACNSGNIKIISLYETGKYLATDTLFIGVDGDLATQGNFEIGFFDGSKPPTPVPLRDCELAQNICTPSITVADPGSVDNGNVCDLPATAVSCSGYSTLPEQTSSWYYFTTSAVGTLSFDIIPSLTGTNYDWALYSATGYTTNPKGVCGTASPSAGITGGVTVPVSCNYNTATDNTGMGTGLPAAAYNASVATAVGNEYLLYISNTSLNNTGYTLNFGASPIGPAGNLVWQGATSTDWTDATNWGDCGISPSCATGATISTGVNQPTISGVQSVRDLIITPGTTLTLDPGARLDVCGSFTNNGSLVMGANATVQFIGSASQFIYGNVTAANAFENLRINKSAIGTYAATGLSQNLQAGGKSFTIATGLTIPVGSWAYISDAVAPTNWAHGYVTGYNSGTGVLSVSVPTNANTATPGATSWNITIHGAVTMTVDVDVKRNFITSTNESLFLIGQGLTIAPATTNYPGKKLRLAGAMVLRDSTTLPWLNTAPAQNSTLEFNGSGAIPQTITNQNSRASGNGIRVFNLIMNQSPASTVTLSAAGGTHHRLAVSSLLTLTSGRLIASTGALQAFNGSEIWVTNIAAASIVAGNVAAGTANSLVEGYLRRNMQLAGTYRFPVGFNGALNEAAFVRTSASAGQLRTIFKNWSSNGGLPAGGPGPTFECTFALWNTWPPMNHGYWTMDSVSGVMNGAAGYQLVLKNNVNTVTNFPGWVAGPQPSGMWAAPLQFATSIMKRTPSGSANPWVLNGTCVLTRAASNGAVGSRPDSTVRQAMSGFSDFATVQFNSPLPIELLFFNAELSDDGVLCSWSTASEINNDHFDVERSHDGATYEKIGEVKGAGNSSSTLNYQFVDKDPCEGVVYYRLKQVDYNEMFTYSDAVAVTCGVGEHPVRIFPNPAQQKINYSFFLNKDSNVEVQLIDMLGNVVKTEQCNCTKGFNKLESDISKLASGVYYLKLTKQGGDDLPIKEVFIKQ